MSQSIENDEIKCCGSGCNNCVLDERKRSKSTNRSSSKNILTVNDSKYVKFSLQNKWKCTENVWRYRFAYANKDDLLKDSLELAIPPGCHIMMRVTFDEINPQLDRHDQTTVGNFVSRPYTPIQVDNRNGSFEILVKFEPNGKMSNYLQNISIGDIVEIKGPYGEFIWKAKTVNNLICVSQGVGIVPMFAIVASILDDEDDETWIDFLPCFRSIDDILLRNEIHEFRQYWNFQSSIYLANETSCTCDRNHRIGNCVCIRSKMKYNEMLCTFRLDEIELTKIFIGKRIENCLILICGTSRFINSIKMSLKKLHIKDENIFVFD